MPVFKDHTKFTEQQKKTLSAFFGGSKIQYFPDHIHIVKRLSGWAVDPKKKSAYQRPFQNLSLHPHPFWTSFKKSNDPDSPQGTFSKFNSFDGSPSLFDGKTIKYTFEIVPVTPKQARKKDLPTWTPKLGVPHIYSSNTRFLYEKPLPRSRKIGSLKKDQIVLVLNHKLRPASGGSHFFAENTSVVLLPEEALIYNIGSTKAYHEGTPGTLRSGYSVYNKRMKKQKEERRKVTEDMLGASKHEQQFPLGMSVYYSQKATSETCLSGWVQISCASGIGWINIVQKPVDYFERCFYDEQNPRFLEKFEEKKAKFENPPEPKAKKRKTKR